MKRRNTEHASSDDGVQDSFLDIVANIVGILILLVVVVGIRAAMQPAIDENEDSQPPQPLLTHTVLEKKRGSLEKELQHVVDLRSGAVNLAREAEHLDQVRHDLASYVTEVEEELTRKKAELDTTKAKRLALRTKLAETDIELDELMREKIALQVEPLESEKIVHTPTPIVRKGTDRSLHLRLENNRVAIVPFDRLIDQASERPPASRLRDLNHQGGVAQVRPIGGFELLYGFIPKISKAGPQGIRPIAVATVGEVRPVEDNLGVPVSVALEANSELDQALRSTTPRETVVVLWVYGDSVTASREIQEYLRSRGFAVDFRLLSPGTHISFSSEGREAAGQ